MTDQARAKALSVEGPVLPGSIVLLAQQQGDPADLEAAGSAVVAELRLRIDHDAWMLVLVRDDAVLRVLHVEEWAPAVVDLLRPMVASMVRAELAATAPADGAVEPDGLTE